MHEHLQDYLVEGKPVHTVLIYYESPTDSEPKGFVEIEVNYRTRFRHTRTLVFLVFWAASGCWRLADCCLCLYAWACVRACTAPTARGAQGRHAQEEAQGSRAHDAVRRPLRPFWPRSVLTEIYPRNVGL
jgi:hypothetical protein